MQSEDPSRTRSYEPEFSGPGFGLFQSLPRPFCWKRVMEAPGTRLQRILGFHPRDETAIIWCTKQKTFYSIVLYINMAAVTSDETPQ